MSQIAWMTLAIVTAGALLGATPGTAAEAPEPEQASPGLLQPSRATLTAPDQFRVRLETTKGDIVIEVNRDWAPNGADRFYNLVKLGFYDGAVFFRVIRNPDPFMAQVGYHADPEVTRAWAAAQIPDDPILQPIERGTVCFAMSSSPNSRTTQFFINYRDNSYLRQYGAFAPFGRVVEGMTVADQLYAGYGEGAPSGQGPSQAMIQREGNAYLEASFPKLDAIKRAVLVETPAEPESKEKPEAESPSAG
jgi:peptidyl-prolyl cis-trans isomerase A (cyclophilin A)